MTFDMEGRYVPQNFENIFTKYDKENKGGLTWADVLEMAKGQRMVFDFFGWNATLFECEYSCISVAGDLINPFVRLGHSE